MSCLVRHTYRYFVQRVLGMFRIALFIGFVGPRRSPAAVRANYPTRARLVDNQKAHIQDPIITVNSKATGPLPEMMCAVAAGQTLRPAISHPKYGMFKLGSLQIRYIYFVLLFVGSASVTHHDVQVHHCLALLSQVCRHRLETCCLWCDLRWRHNMTDSGHWVWPWDFGVFVAGKLGILSNIILDKSVGPFRD